MFTDASVFRTSTKIVKKLRVDRFECTAVDGSCVDWNAITLGEENY